jgi:hypothetical protein
MRDHRRAADRLDAPRLGLRRQVAVDAAAREINCDKSRLEISGHQRERAPSRAGHGARGERERSGTQEECPSIHGPFYEARARRSPRSG